MSDGVNPIGRVFQSTPPARGATDYMANSYTTRLFQSTPPARGATKAEGYTG